MSNQLLISVTSGETRSALVEGGLLQEIQIERQGINRLVGNIYKAKVTRVMPGMQAAFVDIGLDRAGFLHESDIPTLNKNGLECSKEEPQNIFDKVHDGKTLLVQVAKSPMGSKGARLTTQLSLSARYLVYMPQSEHLGVSQRIADDGERERLRDLITVLAEEQEMPGGFIARTAAEGVGEEDLERDMLFLKRRWQHLLEQSKAVKSPSCLHTDLPLVLRVVRDISATNLEKIRVDCQHSFDSLNEFIDTYCPQLKPLVSYYQDSRPLFDLYSIEDEISRALQPIVPLKSGGSLVIEQTEAMVTVDVNTGAYVGSRDLEETILKTNLEAASAIARQLRLRNLGGIVVLDFIDMYQLDNQKQVARVLKNALDHDRAKTIVSEVSTFGLIEMTRKRDSESLVKALCEPCPECLGAAVVKSAETLCFDIYREIVRRSYQFESGRVLIVAAEQVIERMSDLQEELEAIVSADIEFKIDSQFHQDQYNIVPLLSVGKEANQ